MRVGTKSVLFGVHAVWIHPFFVAWAWWKLFGFPWDFRLWFAFFLHDAGYLCKRDMDGFEGEQHVVLGGRIMGWLFGPEWRDFTLCHSRHWAKRVGKRYSKLCLADKLAFVLTPGMALSSHGTVEWRASRVHACGERTPVVRQYH